MHIHTLIIGAGPGGLSCAQALAKSDIPCLVLERKQAVGPKVCAGGITWSGLISRVPRQLAERSFPVQHIISPLQKIAITEEDPIIATVNRRKLGEFMARQALDSGATLRCGVVLRKIYDHHVLVQDKNTGEQQKISFDYLVGADGSVSQVRRYLGLSSHYMGIGINYQIPQKSPRMEWHLNNRLFKNGYAWIFPHAETTSVGAYVDRKAMPAARLKANLMSWAGLQNIDLQQYPAKAEYINYDFQGWNFGKTFLVGDAAGLASGLTGEGIYPAIISGEEVARTIINKDHSSSAMERLIANHDHHSRLVRLSGHNSFFNSILAELVTLGLRSGIVKFSSMEMAL
jgi:geranylgeranyl reductase